jgi:hypothetical protein
MTLRKNPKKETIGFGDEHQKAVKTKSIRIWKIFTKNRFHADISKFI